MLDACLSTAGRVTLGRRHSGCPRWLPHAQRRRAGVCQAPGELPVYSGDCLTTLLPCRRSCCACGALFMLDGTCYCRAKSPSVLLWPAFGDRWVRHSIAFIPTFSPYTHHVPSFRHFPHHASNALCRAHTLLALQRSWRSSELEGKLAGGKHWYSIGLIQRRGSPGGRGMCKLSGLQAIMARWSF